MKRLIFLCLFLTLTLNTITSNEVAEKDLYEYNNLVAKINKVTSPVVTENYVIFTADASSRFVGIAFDFENYQNIHPFQIRKTKDVDGNTRN